eukprot:TRINITY_DN10300_c0_g1_i4.p1 TRINITY_DN10300_c0_g1~~TRINITY_DN10300_c0_g1_i4.p1  ORF type:complete len:428 (+),score=56.64 TRINITY_DN10300_c0_g1_i4:14-1297(+)
MFQCEALTMAQALFSHEVEKALKTDYEIALGAKEGSTHWNLIRERLCRPPMTTTVRLNGCTLDDVAAELPDGCKLHECIQDLIAIPVTRQDYKPAEKAVVVGAMCGMAVLRGSQVYMPGIKAIESGICQGDKVAIFADLTDTCPRGLTERFEGPTAFVGNGVIQISRRRFFQQEHPSGMGVDMTEPCYVTPSLGQLEPKLVLQNLPSVLCGHVLAPKPGETVLDMCAAPGGKTAHLACLMQGQGRLVALERSKKRATALEARMQVLGHDTLVEVHTLDATRCLEGSKGNKIKFPEESFDRVLLDAPCSGLGQRPRFIITTPATMADLEEYGFYQRKLLSVAAKAVKLGGRLVYSTCSLNPRENEHVVAWALQQLPLRLVVSEPRLGGDGLPNHRLSSEECCLVQRFDPVKHDTIGFFIACFEKIEPS